LKPQDALTFGAAIQVARLMGGQLGQAFVVTLTRVRSQTASNLIGLHIHTGDGAVLQRLNAYAAVARRSDPDPVAAAQRAAGILGNIVRSAAATQGIIDSFVVVAAATLLALMLAVAHRPAPIGPASHLPLFAKRETP
jgi:DHA2 family multidrug resistance protein